MTATDELRAMLDERGVKYVTDDEDGCEFTEWMANGLEWEADSRGDLVYLSPVTLITPAQAIAATLGAGTCHVKAAKKIGDLFGFSLSCGHSMVNPFNDRPDYCPWCGAKVVDE